MAENNAFIGEPLEKIWISSGLPFRSVSGTYGTSLYQNLPTIKILPQFVDIKTLKDVLSNSQKIDKLIQSMTSCYVAVNEKDKSFYRDQQDCVIWYFEETKGVLAKFDSNNDEMFVSPDIPTFLSRLYIEALISRKYMQSFFDVTQIMFSKPSIKKWIEMFEQAKKVMDKESFDYVSNYYESGLLLLKK